MKVYLVGGAVRDQLLGLPVKERDWVVVGARPQALLEQGFIKVGRNFPVFLHPKTKEEYALARVERKKGHGYYGFECDFSDSVRLEEDLARRDLTINAMAMDEDQRLIDPYQGQKDLDNRILRHVSKAFVEDPVRVLRVARFAARFHAEGFRLANETRELMVAMVQNGELAHLVPERVWQEWALSLAETTPEQFILILRACDALRVVLPEINDLFGVPNLRGDTPIIDSGLQGLMALNTAVSFSSDPKIRFAALVSNLGLSKTPIQAWPNHEGQEELGLLVIKSLSLRLCIPTEFKSLALQVCRLQKDLQGLDTLDAPAVVHCLEQADAFRRPELFKSLLKAALAGQQEHLKHWTYLFQECVKISAKDMIDLGYKNKAIKEALHQHRANLVETILRSWRRDEK